MRRFLQLAAVYGAIIALGSAAADINDAPSPTPRLRAADAGAAEVPPVVLTAALEQFSDCDSLLTYFKTAALKRVGPYGLGGPPHVYYSRAAAAEGAAGAPVDFDAPEVRAAAAAKDAGDGRDFSTTNVQEAGVDEPDTVKTDGRRILVLRGRRLHVLVDDGDGLRRAGSVRVPTAGEVLLEGDRALVLGREYGHALLSTSRVGAPLAGTTTLTAVDIADPTAPTVTATLELDGDYVSARLVDGVARVVVRSQPVDLPFRMPDGGGLRSRREAKRHNVEVVQRSTVEDWLPHALAKDRTSGRETEQSLLDCDAVHHPARFAGFGLVSVMSVDLAAEPMVEGAAAVVGDSDTVYATADNLYVALNRWGRQPWMTGRSIARDSGRTELHQFDISDPGGARYTASGSVRGRLLNQWALSEHEGHLRVATTRDDPTRRRRTDSAVALLRRDGTELEQVGIVGGLGRGEQIYAVRYAGDIGYVVTFRQVDPLYTLDLSDPQRPRVRGELKITGYSSYLHPLDGDTIVGVGQDATARGRVVGSQLSLFDVGDLAQPRLVDRADLGEGSSVVEYDHRAFLYWPQTRTLVIPHESWVGTPRSNAVVLRVEGGRLEVIGRVSHPASITRSLVIDDTLLTVSDAGVLASSLDTLEERGWIPLRPRR